MMKHTSLIGGALLLAGCGGGPQPPESVLPAGHPTVAAPSLEAVTTEAPTRSGMPSSGTVLEAIPSGGYTYARMSIEGGEIWVAGPETPLEVGQRVALAGATPMGSFTSKSLDRTFDEIFFVGAYQPAEAPAEASRGEVVEVLAGGGYTYVNVKVAEDTVWLAGPETTVEKGATVAWTGAMEMGEFHSPSLGRTFDNIYFVGRIWVER